MTQDPSDSGEPLNVMLLMCDQLPSHALGCMGHPLVKTPNIDSLAETGVTCTHAFAQSPVCCPSRASQLTGLYPQNHGILSNMCNLDIMNPNVRLLTDLFHEQGFATAQIGKWHCLRKFEDATFTEKKFLEESIPCWPQTAVKEHYPSMLKKTYVEHGGQIHAATHPLDRHHTGPALITDRTLAFLEKHRHRPLMARVSYLGPHTPVLVPEPFDSMYDPRDVELPQSLMEAVENRPEAIRKLVASSRSRRTKEAFRTLPEMTAEMAVKTHVAYSLGLISHIDEQIGRILDRLEHLGLREKTVILFTADHGGFWGDYGLLGKNLHALYRPLCQVPMIVSCPGTVPQGRKLDGWVEVVDQFPTLMDFAGVKHEFRINGRSIKQAILHGTDTGREDVLTQSASYNGGPSTAALRDKDFTFIYWANTGETELYDIRADPDERLNLADRKEYRQTLAVMKERLLARIMTASDVHMMPAPETISRSPIDLTPDQDFDYHQKACVQHQLGKGNGLAIWKRKPGHEDLSGLTLKELARRASL